MKSEKDRGLLLRFNQENLEDPVHVLCQLLDVMFSPEDDETRHHIRADMMLQTIAVLSGQAAWESTCNDILWQILAPSLQSIYRSTTTKKLTAEGERSRAAFDNGLCAGYVLLMYLRLLRHKPPHMTVSIRRSMFFVSTVFKKAEKQVQAIWYAYREVAPLWAAILIHLSHIRVRGNDKPKDLMIAVWPIEFLNAPRESLEFIHQFFTIFLLMGCCADRQRTYSEKGTNVRAKKLFNINSDVVHLELDWVRPEDMVMTWNLPQFFPSELVILRKYRARTHHARPRTATRIPRS
ncbi:MAG TPA: hypothetical protein PLB67_17115 [Candidatus Hydrogenedentes bacterium]|nr:hypothetical protein [Candidatus Hydrogenedentota bacterium]